MAEVVTQLIAVDSVEQISESAFYIPMTGPAARPRRSLKHDDTFIVLDSHGDIGASAGGLPVQRRHPLSRSAGTCAG
jgi:hypothetical protein